MQHSFHPLENFNESNLPFVNSSAIGHVFIKPSHMFSINFKQLFFSYFNCVPNVLIFQAVNTNKFETWFHQHFRNEIKDYNHSTYYSKKYKKENVDFSFFHLFEDTILFINNDYSRIHIYYKFSNKEKIKQLKIEIEKCFLKKQSLPHIYMLVMTETGLKKEEVLIKKTKNNLLQNYNDDFITIHETILKKLSKKDEKGIVILHGKPGTGKTSYIRYLINIIKKNIIFVPASLADQLTSPHFIPFLIQNKNSILIIEDAENIVINREENQNSTVSALLNISDGLMSDFLNIQIICSFNVDINKVDSALLRKGRLIAQYEFKELVASKAQILSNQLGFQTTIEKPMSLTDIYNQVEIDFASQQPQRAKIGF
jgi:hypothetical protein